LVGRGVAPPLLYELETAGHSHGLTSDGAAVAKGSHFNLSAQRKLAQTKNKKLDLCYAADAEAAQRIEIKPQLKFGSETKRNFRAPLQKAWILHRLRKETFAMVARLALLCCDACRFTNTNMETGLLAALILAFLVFAVALLYSTVGHAGASGYLAAMALFGMTPLVMKPTALTLNIIVAVIGTVRFYLAGYFSWRIFWPFAIASIPASFLGGAISLPVPVYKSIVGLVLLYSAVRLFFSARAADHEPTNAPPIGIALVLGAALGLLSGLTGVGGGIFLSPLLLLMHWAKTKETSATSVTFILVNSIAGLIGQAWSGSFVPADVIFKGHIVYLAPAALVGGWIGTELGTRVLPIAGIRRWLSVVLVVAGLKLLSEVILAMLH
jgi:uncharacterized protein